MKKRNWKKAFTETPKETKLGEELLELYRKERELETEFIDGCQLYWRSPLNIQIAHKSIGERIDYISAKVSQMIKRRQYDYYYKYRLIPQWMLDSNSDDSKGMVKYIKWRKSMKGREGGEE